MRDCAMDCGNSAGAVAGAAAGHHVGGFDLHPHGHAARASGGASSRDCHLKGKSDQGLGEMNIYFPYQFDGRGRTQQASLEDYIRQLVEQVLFTSPGERVNLPDFGSGLLQLPFAPNSVEMQAATQFSVQAALQKWLSAYVKVLSVVASADDSVLTVTVTYTPLNTDVTQVQTYVYGGSTA